MQAKNQNTTKPNNAPNTPFPGPKPGEMAAAFVEAFGCGPQAGAASAHYKPGRTRSLSERRLIEQDLADSIDVVLGAVQDA